MIDAEEETIVRCRVCKCGSPGLRATICFDCACRALPTATFTRTTWILGIDPGPTRSAWSLVEAMNHPHRVTRKPSYLASGIIEGDETQQTGALKILTSDLAGLLDGRAFLTTVEAVEGFAFRATSKRGGGQAVVAALMRTSRMVGELVRQSKNLGWPTCTITASRARKRVLNRANARNPVIKATLPRLVLGWPKVSNNHVRDAGVAALAAAWTLQSTSVHELDLAGTI